MDDESADSGVGSGADNVYENECPMYFDNEEYGLVNNFEDVLENEYSQVQMEEACGSEVDDEVLSDGSSSSIGKEMDQGNLLGMNDEGKEVDPNACVRRML